MKSPDISDLPPPPPAAHRMVTICSSVPLFFMQHLNKVILLQKEHHDNVWHVYQQLLRPINTETARAHIAKTETSGRNVSTLECALTGQKGRIPQESSSRHKGSPSTVLFSTSKSLPSTQFVGRSDSASLPKNAHLSSWLETRTSGPEVVTPPDGSNCDNQHFWWKSDRSI